MLNLYETIIGLLKALGISVPAKKRSIDHLVRKTKTKTLSLNKSDELKSLANTNQSNCFR